MATANNTIKTRIQLKSDTEENWNKAGPKQGSPGFVPMRGELIIYSADESHAFSRLKVGDGTTNVTNLPFIDSGTLNGEYEFILKYATFNDFPSPGKEGHLYIDLATNKIYHYTNSTSYRQLSNVSYTTASVSNISLWNHGEVPTCTVQNNILTFISGSNPSLVYNNIAVVNTVS